MANEITWDDVLATAKAEAEDLSTFSASEQEMILEETYCHVPDNYGCYTKILRRYWAADRAVQSLVLAAGEGAKTNENIGSVSAGQNQPVNNPTAEQGHLETTYGRSYYYYITEYRKRYTIPFGIYSAGKVSGLPHIPPAC